MSRRQDDHLLGYQNVPQQPPQYDQYGNNVMSGPYQQPGYNPHYQNPPYGANAPPPSGWNPHNQQAPPFMPPPHPGMMGMAGMAEEGNAGDKYHFNFNERTVRAAFIRKVFTLVTIMLLVVAIMTALPFINRDINLKVRSSMGMYWAAYGVFFVVYLALVCCESVRRSFPANLILTTIFTLAVGYMTMMITAHHRIETVLFTLIICTICCGGIVIFATQTKYDLTNMMGFLFIASLCLMVFGIVAAVSVIWFKSPFLHLIYAALASLLFMFYLAVDIQMLMGGRKYEISPEDHIFAAVQIFLDIVYIFWMLLSLFGSSNN